MTREVWITGIGLVSSLGEGVDAHWQALAGTDRPRPAVRTDFVPPYAIHPMVELDLGKQIPKRGDQRQMEAWQRLGTYAAGVALDDAGIAGDMEVLSRTHAVIAADGGARDEEADAGILEDLAAAENHDALLNERLTNDLRPTLFLAQLPNLLAGNISIVHKVTGSSRTFMGEEIAGASAVEVAARRIAAGQGDIFLTGAAYQAERKDTILNCVLGNLLWEGAPVPVWQRLDNGGGTVLGSAGAFLVLEAPDHAAARGRRPYARLQAVAADQSRRRPGEVAAKLGAQFDAIAPAGEPPVAVLSGATGIAPASVEERDLLARLADAGRVTAVRAMGTMLGSVGTATYPVLLGLAALAISREGFYPVLDGSGTEVPLAEAPDRIAVTAAGIWRGEGTGLVTRIA